MMNETNKRFVIPKIPKLRVPLMEDDDETFDCTDDAYKNAVQNRNHD